MSLTLKQNKA